MVQQNGMDQARIALSVMTMDWSNMVMDGMDHLTKDRTGLNAANNSK